MARTTRRTSPEGRLAIAHGVAVAAPAGVRMETRRVREAPARGHLVGNHSIASNCLPPRRLLGSDLPTGAEATSLESSADAFEAAPLAKTIELDCLDGDLLRRRWRSVMGLTRRKPCPRR
jgi:hypothetical protein